MIETTKPTPEQQKLQSLFQQSDIESIVLLVKENEELLAKLKAWEKCADDLIDYAHEFVQQLSAWGKGYDRHDRQIKTAEDAIEAYNKLKKAK